MDQFPHRRTFSEPARQMESWATWTPDPCEYPSEENSPADLKLFLDLSELKDEPGLFGPPTPTSEEGVRVLLESLGGKASPSPAEKEMGLVGMRRDSGADDSAQEADKSPVAGVCQVEVTRQENFGMT